MLMYFYLHFSLVYITFWLVSYYFRHVLAVLTCLPILLTYLLFSIYFIFVIFILYFYLVLQPGLSWLELLISGWMSIMPFLFLKSFSNADTIFAYFLCYFISISFSFNIVVTMLLFCFSFLWLCVFFLML